MKINFTGTIVLLITLAVIMTACYTTHYYPPNFRNEYDNISAAYKDSTGGTLKAHLKNGSLAIFDKDWKVDSAQSVITGNGIFYDFNRVIFKQGLIELPVKNVALFETNKKIKSLDADRITGMTILTVLDVVGGILCLVNPKACFGSCPTFYVEGNNNLLAVNAEGFSDAITPSFEASDIDALNNVPVTKQDFILTMKNEAWETHSVNQVKILAVPRNRNEKIFHSVSNEFFSCSRVTPVHEATCAEGNCTTALRLIDQAERFSPADSDWLNTKENIDLTFENINFDHQGLILNFRQTLLTTFLLYTAYGYMGDETGSFLAEIETNKLVRNKMRNRLDLLGGIEVYTWNENKKSWKYSGMFHETGPIAKNLQLLVLDGQNKNHSSVKIQLRLTKGLWRLDYAALASVDKKILPLELAPVKVFSGNRENPKALAKLQYNDEQYLTSMPGDSYKLHFHLPGIADDFELFVFSKGYYLEWIRGEWLRNKNTDAFKKMMSNDRQTWIDLAHEFKTAEPSMEATFWSSNVVQ